MCSSGFNDFFGGVAHGFGDDEIQSALAQNLAPLLDVGSFQAKHHGQGQSGFLGGFDHAVGERIHAQDAAKNIDEHGANVLIAEQDLEGVFYLLGAGAAADVEKISGLAAGIFDDVHSSHRQTGAIHHAGDVAFELDVVQAKLAGFDLQRIFFARVAQLFQIFVAEHGAIVKGPLGVEREQAPIFGSDEGIDLGERGVGGVEGLVKRGHELYRLIYLLRLEAEGKSQLARLEWLKSHAGLNVFLQNGVWIFGRDLFDLHTAGDGGHEHRLAGVTINDDAKIEFAIDGQSFFDQQALNFFTLRPGLVGHQIHTQHLGGDFGRLFR